MTREEVTAESQATTRTAKSLTTSPNLESAEDTLEDVRDKIQWRFVWLLKIGLCRGHTFMRAVLRVR